MVTLAFREVRRQVEATLNCRECGKQMKRKFTGSATYNPFNDGDPPTQALEDAIRQKDRAIEKGVICKWCEDRPQREALIAFDEGKPLPRRKWGNATDLLEDRGHIKERFEDAQCSACGQPHFKSLGYEITEKGRRKLERDRTGIAKLKRGKELGGSSDD